jgi:hypothetical protein
MKRFNFFLSMLLLLVMVTGCKEDFDTPPMVVPTSTLKANTTIAELKAKYWNDARNFADTIKEDIVIHGYVTSSDEHGNVYKYLFIQDETAGFGISIDANSIYNYYRLGQEVFIKMKDLWVGKYNGQYLIGKPEWYAERSVWEAGRMPIETLQAHAEINGLPDQSKVAPVVTKISDFLGKGDKETQVKYQGLFVKFEDVKWQEADGEAPYSLPDASTNRTIVDENGNALTVVNSNYSDFRAEILPLGKGSVQGILYMTGSDQWKLMLRDTGDCIGFDASNKGTKVNPYTVDEAIASVSTEKHAGWVKGYMVGAVAPEKQAVASSADIEWKAPTTLDNTLVIAPTPDETDITKCMIIDLKQNTPMRQQANLRDNVDAYKTIIFVKGTFGSFMGQVGINDNSGSTDEFMMTVITGGVESLNEGFESGLPSDWANVQVKGDKKWYQTSFDNNGYAAMTGYKGTAPFDSWLITPPVDIKKAANKTLTFRTQVNGYGSTTTHFEVYILDNADPTIATVKTKLNPTIATAPASGYSTWAQSGNLDLSQFNGTYYIGFRYEAASDANYATWCVDDVKFNSTGGGGGDDPTPPAPVSGTRADLETLNNGQSASKYGTYTSAAGWKLTNGNVLVGGTVNQNPVFQFIGFVPGSTTVYAMAASLNGNTGTVGTLVSPTLKGGMKKLTFNYGAAYTDTQVSFRVDVKQGGNVVKSFTVTKNPVAKFEVYNFSEALAITGEFTLEFTNLCPSNLTSNKDRVALWNIEWEQ